MMNGKVIAEIVVEVLRKVADSEVVVEIVVETRFM
jgi:hypothetical protein